ncbi:DUF4214 domain-containing protein [Halomonas sp.]|uniref:DUF4214 domain-containing protein n=1 Tax=Halomonas sp. TaxID=1486246 RepID=UPI00385113A6
MANGTFFASLVRLYHATFDRSSDIEGVGYWASKLAKGEMTFQQVAESFMESPEFQEKYGEDLTNEEFVKLLYENVLDREPDEEGLAYWVKVLEEGSLRNEVLIGFSESEEHIDKIDSEHSDELSEAEAIENSLDEDDSEDDLEDDSDDDSDEELDDDSEDDDSDEELDDDSEEDDSEDDDSEDDDSEDDSEDDDSEDDDSEDDDSEGDLDDDSKVDDDDSEELDDDSDDDDDDSDEDLTDEEELILLYNAAFDRAPDQEGLGYWMGELASSKLEFDDVIELFMESEEFTDRYGDDLTDYDFIEALYNNTLGRASDAEGKGFWISQLASGKDRGDILESFAGSDEHIDIVLTGTSDNTDDTLF